MRFVKIAETRQILQGGPVMDPEEDKEWEDTDEPMPYRPWENTEWTEEDDAYLDDLDFEDDDGPA